MKGHQSSRNSFRSKHSAADYALAQAKQQQLGWCFLFHVVSIVLISKITPSRDPKQCVCVRKMYDNVEDDEVQDDDVEDIEKEEVDYAEDDSVEG